MREIIKEPNNLLHQKCEPVSNFDEAKQIAGELLLVIKYETRFPFPYLETCYSLNRKETYLVKRYLWAKVKYQDMNGIWHQKILRGPSAIYQEIDHINGIMVSDIGLKVL